LGLALAFALERYDRRIKNIDEIAEVYGTPLLSVIPHVPRAVEAHHGKASVPPPLREPFRSLRTNVQLASLDRPIKCVVVASAVAGEGKSTIVSNLALTYCELGLSVVVVEADMRRPTLCASWGVAPGPGLTAVLADASEIEEALIEIELDAASPDYADVGGPTREAGRRPDAPPGSSHLALLPSGLTPSNPQAVLGADKMQALIERLSELFDIVLIDTPPLLAVSDAIPLLTQADGVILVTRVGLTERRSGQRAGAATRLDSTVRVLGVVANDVAHQPGAGYGYGYGYGPAYG
jgi:Mrp family chromosome partitioning ATPase